MRTALVLVGIVLLRVTSLVARSHPNRVEIARRIFTMTASSGGPSLGCSMASPPRRLRLRRACEPCALKMETVPENYISSLTVLNEKLALPTDNCSSSSSFRRHD